ncbi:serum response factor-like isoform X1 [Amphibalanus amphitrite]|uniref:serum response factor-like isoform X1 n=1 Tax=Amphibalanus amphitrite TaxID=1232801 RepID=UPI001C907B5A|nr:serum response factor-like isoform X1 [Amphibalanus amphitrite]
MQNSSGDGNGQDSQHYSLNFPVNPSSEFYHNLTSSSSSVSNIPGLLRLAPTSPMGMPVVSSGIQTVAGASHGYVVPGSNPLKRTAQDAGFSDQRQCEMPSSDDDGSISDKFSIPQTSVSPTEGQPKISDASPVVKKTKGRVKIKMEFIDNKLRRYTTFSKRKTGIMKKAYELSTLTGTQVMLLVASETGHVYTFATRKLQPMITSEAGKALIQTCLNSPDPSASAPGTGDQRMSATGFEETELCYNINEDEQKEEYEEDGVEEVEDDEQEQKPSNGFYGHAPQLSEPSGAVSVATVMPAAVSLTPVRAVGTVSSLSGGTIPTAPVVTASSAHTLLTTQLLSQIKQSQQLALHLAASSAQQPSSLHLAASSAQQPSCSSGDGPRLVSTPMSSLFQTSPGLLQLPEGLVLLNSPSTVIQAVKPDHAGEPPNSSQPTDLSKSRVSS